MNKKYNLKLDLQFRCNNSTMKFDEFDNNTSDFFIRVTRAGELIDISKAIVTLVVIKPDNSVDAQFVDIDSNRAYCDLKPTMKNLVGKYEAIASITVDGETVNTGIDNPIIYEVTENKFLRQLNQKVVTEERFTLLTDMINRLSTIEISEEQRVINEAERILSEENRKIEEAKRVEAELIRQHEEADRAKYDAIRESNENIRKQNESIRLANETNRIDEEAKRAEEENKRKLAEEERNANYNFMTEDEERRRLEANAHKEAEILRVQAETNRVNEEAKRRTTEQARVSVENTRVSNENTRKANETIRQTNETQRVEAETQRQSRYNSFITDAEANASNFENYTNTAKVKEEERKSNELDRKSQEARRVSNEVERISNENTRKANEKAREKNETSRQNIFENKVSEVDEKIIELDTTKDNFVSSINTKVDTKISELNTTKDNFVSSVNTKVDNKISELDTAKSDMTNTVSKKVNEVENRFNALTSSQQQSSEVIDARDGETSLKARLDRDTEQINNLSKELDRVKKLEESTVSTVTTESGFTTVEATSNGYFEDVKLEGKTLVNMLKPVSYILSAGEFTKDDYTISNSRNYLKYVKTNTNKTPTWIYVSCGKLPFDMLKPNTKYTIKLDKYVGVASVEFKCGDGTKKISNIGVIDANGCAVVTTVSELVNADQVLYLNLKSRTVSEVEVSDVILLEGDHTQNPPSYFEGLKSVGDETDEIVVESVNENLFDGELEIGTLKDSTGLEADYSAGYRSKNYIRVDGNETYYYGFDINNAFTSPNIYCYDKDKKFISTIPNQANSKLNKFTTPSNCKYIRIRIFDITNFENTSVTNVFISKKDYYTPHQSDKKRLLYYNTETQAWEKPTLREWDSIEKHTDGKYYYHVRSIEEDYVEGDEIVTDYITDMTTTVKPLSQEKVYECTNIDLITYNWETNYIVESGAIVPKTTLKVHNNISNVVSLLQKKVSLLESNVTSYMITQNRLMLASRYNADTVSFKVDVASFSDTFEYDNDLYELILNNILVGKDNYNREYIENLTRFYWMDFVISDEMYSTLFEIIEEQHNPKIEEETPLI